MGSGVFSTSLYADYSARTGGSYDYSTGRVEGKELKATHLSNGLDPRNFKLRECANSDEHPNTIPVILALDVTGSMGDACTETLSALGVIVTNLYEKFQDIEFCIMGIGDLECDDAPVQMSQFESDVRIAAALDQIYREQGGGGNGYESYTVAWYMGLKRTKLDAFDKQGRKGIIITMGDEPLNPILYKDQVNHFVNAHEEADITTEALFRDASEKFNIYHIAVDSPDSMFRYYKKRIDKTFKPLLDRNYKVSTIDNLAKTIEQCISESVENQDVEVKSGSNGIEW